MVDILKMIKLWQKVHKTDMIHVTLFSDGSGIFLDGDDEEIFEFNNSDHFTEQFLEGLLND